MNFPCFTIFLKKGIIKFIDMSKRTEIKQLRARKQIAWLRAICADPKHLVVPSNMNPKIIAILELARDILGQGEQVVIINSL